VNPLPIQVMLVEDHRLVREALAEALGKELDIRIVGEAGDAASALAMAVSLQPDVVVVDINLPDFSGIELARQLRERVPKLLIVALSAYTDKCFVTEMLRAGAQSYVTKSAAGLELVQALRAVTAGQPYVSPDVAGMLVAAVQEETAREERPQLGRREREVLRLIAQGHRTPAIAQRLFISPMTVEAHRRNIMRKLGLHTVAELTRYAVRQGLVPP
jgi:two-component system NarL family response regulator